MNQLYIFVALVAAFASADEKPFSIGLGVLSPSYSQTVGPENVKVNFEQKDGGFSYSVGDPKSGTNTFLNFGSAAGNQAINPAGYADADTSSLAGPSPAGYAGPSPAGHAGPNPAGYEGPSPSGYEGPSPAGYAGPSPAGYAGPSPAGFAGPSSAGYAGPSSAGYAGPSALGYGGPSAAYQQPSLSGYGSAGFGAADKAYGGSFGFTGPYNGPSPAGQNGYVGGESARKPEEPAGILPAGFSYHGTEGQSFLNHGDESPNFMVSDEGKGSARGPAEISFADNFNTRGQQGSGRVLVNGLVGYGPGGQRGSLPVGGYAGPQFAGLVREHGGHE